MEQVTNKAVIVAGSPAAVPQSKLIEHSRNAFIVAVDSGANHLYQAQIVPHLLVGDLDSIDPDVRLWTEVNGVKTHVFPTDKDATDLFLALEYLCLEDDSSRVDLFGALGGRLDHELVVLGDCARFAELAPVLYGIERSVRILSPQGVSSYRFPPTDTSQTFSIIALCENAIVSEHDVRWPLDHQRLSPLSGHGLSNMTIPSEKIENDAYVMVHEGVIALYTEEANANRS